MDLNTLLLTLAFLACPLAMGGMIWMMSKQMGSESSHSPSGEPLQADPAERLAALRRKRQALEAEIAEVVKIVELEAERDALRSTQIPFAASDTNASPHSAD